MVVADGSSSLDYWERQPRLLVDLLSADDGGSGEGGDVMAKGGMSTLRRPDDRHDIETDLDLSQIVAIEIAVREIDKASAFVSVDGDFRGAVSAVAASLYLDKDKCATPPGDQVGFTKTISRLVFDNHITEAAQMSGSPALSPSSQIRILGNG